MNFLKKYPIRLVAAVAFFAVASPATAQPSIAASQASTQPVLVFFHFNSLGITPAADSSLREVARSYTLNKAAKVRVVGILNGSGAETSRRNLAERRAEAVRERLVFLGIPLGAITIELEAPRLPALAEPGQPRPAQRRVEVHLD